MVSRSGGGLVVSPSGSGLVVSQSGGGQVVSLGKCTGITCSHYQSLPKKICDAFGESAWVL